MLRLIVQTKRRYKSKKMKMDKKEEGTEKSGKKGGGRYDRQRDKRRLGTRFKKRPR